MSFGKPERCKIENFGPKSKKLQKRKGVKWFRLEWKRKGENAPTKRQYIPYYN